MEMWGGATFDVAYQIPERRLHGSDLATLRAKMPNVMSNTDAVARRQRGWLQKLS